jgi:acyl-coenzyme A synthetase/AMP-(fatty) acid ligase
MTEIGMALSNPYQGERRPGSVGAPLPGVEARVAEDGESWHVWAVGIGEGLVLLSCSTGN